MRRNGHLPNRKCFLPTAGKETAGADGYSNYPARHPTDKQDRKEFHVFN